jgi:tRNA pseudouridine synthase 8/2,5-diamino-6-(5-phospho-D-ribitylamino)-pyrimidin-4(3H)-one deaminase
MSSQNSPATGSLIPQAPVPDKRPRDENGFRLRGKHDRVGQIKKLKSDSSIPIDIEDDAAEGAKYVIDGPLRRVTPYFYTYLTWCKERWRDRLLLDVFSTEFRLRDREYYVSIGLIFLPRN